MKSEVSQGTEAGMSEQFPFPLVGNQDAQQNPQLLPGGPDFKCKCKLDRLNLVFMTSSQCCWPQLFVNSCSLFVKVSCYMAEKAVQPCDGVMW